MDFFDALTANGSGISRQRSLIRTRVMRGFDPVLQLFDAKYRLNPAYEGTTYEKKYNQPGPD